MDASSVRGFWFGLPIRIGLRLGTAACALESLYSELTDSWVISILRTGCWFLAPHPQSFSPLANWRKL